MMYNDYLKTVSRHFQSLFTSIAAVYNFDNGSEFEIVLCKALRAILPQKYGICRGFVVTRDNKKAGDDIIIFDREGFGTLRLLSQDRFERKESIPIEAVYAYIEAKYTLNLEGKDGQSLSKACSQLAKVKNLPRDPLPQGNVFDKHYSAPISFERESWPDIPNPIYGAIIALQVRQKAKKKSFLSSQEIYDNLVGRDFEYEPYPDLVILGKNAIVHPIDKNSNHIQSPFYKDGATDLNVRQTDELAFALGISFLIWAIDTIRLGQFPWSTVIEEGINLNSQD